MIKKEKENLTNFNINLLTCESIISFHLSTITCLIQLKDGRLVSGSKDKRIIIYVKNLFIKAFEINEHSNDISSLLQLNTSQIVLLINSISSWRSVPPVVCITCSLIFYPFFNENECEF